MSRKREKPYFSRHDPTSFAKRRRPLPPHPPPDLTSAEGVSDRPDKRQPPPQAVVVIGLSPNSSVLDLKSRFEIYGAISRIRIDRDGVGNITFRSKESAESAIAASLDPSFAVTVDSTRVQVLWANDPLCQWRKGVAIERNNKDNESSSSSSKLLRGEVPLRRHGRGNKLGSAIVNPRTDTNNNNNNNNNNTSSSVLDVPFKGREIVAYDDIL